MLKRCNSVNLTRYKNYKLLTRSYLNNFCKYLSFTLFLSVTIVNPCTAKEPTWRYLRVDSVEIISDLPEKELKRIHDNLHYYNRIMEIIFKRSLKHTKQTIPAIIVSRSSTYKDLVGPEISKRTAGVFGGLPSIEIIILTEREIYEADSVLFHELAHWNLMRFNPPRWFNEGIATLFDAVEFKSDKIQVGKIDSNMANYILYADNLTGVSYQEMFGEGLNWVKDSSDNERLAFYYINSLMLTHYCLLGQSDLFKALVAFSKEPIQDESTFQDYMGFDFKELENRIWKYARLSRHKVLSFEKSTLPQPPIAEIRLATPNEVSNLFIRAKLLQDDSTEARALLHDMPESDPRSAETRAVLAFVDGDKKRGLEWIKRAKELGIHNPHFEVEWVSENLNQLLKERRRQEPPHLSSKEARAFAKQLTPGLVYFRNNMKAIRTLIQILDASNSKVAKQIDTMFQLWETRESGRYPELKAALLKIRERSGF